jgi:hypothetical protein
MCALEWRQFVTTPQICFGKALRSLFKEHFGKYISGLVKENLQMYSRQRKAEIVFYLRRGRLYSLAKLHQVQMQTSGLYYCDLSTAVVGHQIAEFRYILETLGCCHSPPRPINFRDKSGLAVNMNIQFLESGLRWRTSLQIPTMERCVSVTEGNGAVLSAAKYSH